MWAEQLRLYETHVGIILETSGKNVDYESKVFEKLTGEKKHFCPDWDFMAIDETTPEFQACTCYGRVGGRLVKPMES